MSATASYNVLLNVNKEQQADRVPIAQVVPPQGVDRFIIIVGHTDVDDNELFDYNDVSHQKKEYPFLRAHAAEYEISFTLNFNEGRSIELGSRNIRIVGPVCSDSLLKEKIMHLTTTKW
jgi:hypothetical protein